MRSLQFEFAGYVVPLRAMLSSGSTDNGNGDAKGRLRVMDEIDEHVRPLVDAPIYNTL